MANFIAPAVASELKERLFAAQSIREIASALQISTATVQKYRRIYLSGVDLGLCACGRPKLHTGMCDEIIARKAAESPTIVCGCGKTAFHRGWCSYRYARSPARQAFMQRWLAGRPPRIVRVKTGPRLDLHYPFVPASAPRVEGLDLVLLVNGAVPKGLPEQLRADVCQEIMLAVISGEIEQADIPQEVKRFISRTRQLSEPHYMAFSIDQPRRDGRSWHDILPAHSEPSP